MTKHTPGPWKVHGELAAGGIGIKAGKSWAVDGVAKVMSDKPYREADAALIAAAPDLLLVLKDTLEAMKNFRDNLIETDVRFLATEFNDEIELAENVIAKAEGK